MKPPLDKRLADDAADQVRRSHAESIKELQLLPIAGAVIIRGVEIRSGGGIANVSHGLGRAPQFVLLSAPRYRQSEIADVTAAGVIYDRGAADLAGRPIDRTRTLQFVAVGFVTVNNITVTFDVTVF